MAFFFVVKGVKMVLPFLKLVWANAHAKIFQNTDMRGQTAWTA
jgi:hypothetical protein